MWNWAGVSISLITGFLVSPYLFRKLGPEGYGIWALSFSLIEYYWLLDLGVRSATAKFVAHYWTTEEPAQVSEIMSTAVCYSCLIAAFMLSIVALAAPRIEGFFHISEFLSRIIPSSVDLDDRELVPGIDLQSLFGGTGGGATLRRNQSDRHRHHRFTRGRLVRDPLYGLWHCRARNRNLAEPVPHVRA